MSDIIKKLNMHKPTMLQDLFIPLVTVGLAEIGDKTQLALMGLATKTHRHAELLFGAILGFIVSDGAAILLGSALSTLLPIRTVRLFAGLLFLLFGILTLRGDGEHMKKLTMRTPFLSGFTFVVISEWGDKSQIAAGLFATTYNPWLVFAGVIGVLSLFTVLSLFLGRLLARHLHPDRLRMTAGLIFLLVGILTLGRINA